MLIRNDGTAEKQAVEQGNMEKISFRPMRWGDKTILQCMFNDHSGLGATDFDHYAKPSDQHFALIAEMRNRIAGFITAKVKGLNDPTILDIKQPFIATFLYRQAEIAEEETLPENVDAPSKNGDLTPEIKLTHEFKLAMIAYAKSKNSTLETYRYGLAEGPIFSEIPVNTQEEVPAETQGNSWVTQHQFTAANISPS